MASEAAKAAQAAAEAFVKLGAEKGVAATGRMMASLYCKKGATYEALKLSTPAVAALKAGIALEESLKLVESVEGAIPAGDLGKADAVALKTLTDMATAATGQLNEGQIPAAMKSAKGMLAVFRDLGVKAGEGLALTMFGCACLMAGEPRDAVRAVTEAIAILRELKNKKAEVNALHTLVSASVMKRDIDGALVAAKEIAALEQELGDKKKEAVATGLIAKLELANDDAVLAVKTVEKATALYKGANDRTGQMSALSTEYEICLAQGKPATALKAAQDVVALSKDKGMDKKLQAAAALMAGDAQAASKDSLDAAGEAVSLYKALGSKEGQAAALISLANAKYSQEKKEPDDGLKSSLEAAALFKDAGSKGGEAVAMSAAGVGYMLKDNFEEAEKTLREALSMFRDAADAIGEAYVMNLLKSCKLAGSKPSTARLLVDDSGCAHIELNEFATQESLEAVIAALQSRSAGVSVIVLHLEGCPNTEGHQTYAVSSGTFIMGLRTLGLPVICACWGQIAGPAWGLVLCSDYRISATNTTFVLPLWGPPECLGDMVGHQLAVSLCMRQGPANALSMLEQGVIHQCQRGKEDARKAASEMAKRVATHTSFPVRQTMNLMQPAVERYALAAAKGNVRW